MKDFEVKSGTGCHIFMDAVSYEESLAAILKWWPSVSRLTKTLEAITFTPEDDGTISAMVHWNYLTPEVKGELERELLALRKASPLNPESISGN